MIQHLPNGDILTAISDAARAEMDPLEALNQLEQAWRRENAVPTIRGQGNTRCALRKDMRSQAGPYSCIHETGLVAVPASPSMIEGKNRD